MKRECSAPWSQPFSPRKRVREHHAPAELAPGWSAAPAPRQFGSQPSGPQMFGQRWYWDAGRCVLGSTRCAWTERPRSTTRCHAHQGSRRWEVWLGLREMLGAYGGGGDGRDVAKEIGLDVTGERILALWPRQLAQSLYSGDDLMNRW